jgi:hypothetical protein
MRRVLQRLTALVAMSLLGVGGLAMAATWSPSSVGFVAPASADDGTDDDGADDGSDDDGAQAIAGDDDGTDDDDSNDDGTGDDDDGQAPAGGVDTGSGGAANPADDGGDDDGAGDDDGGQVPAGNDDSGQVPAGGVDTGRGGTSETWTGERASSDGSAGAGDVVGAVAPIAGLGLGALVVGRLALARLRGSQG